MADKAKGGVGHDEWEVNELRQKAYNNPEGTTIDSSQATKDLELPVGREIYLEVVEGKKKGLKYKFRKGNVTIGRSKETADIAIEDDKISRKHALIEAFSRELIFISDLASTNGTFLNGMKVRSIKLKEGDLIKVGNTTLLFQVKDI